MYLPGNILIMQPTLAILSSLPLFSLPRPPIPPKNQDPRPRRMKERVDGRMGTTILPPHLAKPGLGPSRTDRQDGNETGSASQTVLASAATL
ncbi:hypothetical protein B0T19DRAFT_421462, partial [Cercophora scortea]